MSVLAEASGGDGWSGWWVTRQPGVRDEYEILVLSNAERTSDGAAVEVYRSTGVSNGRHAIDLAISVSSEYAHRMSA